jgi:hypothetical protein
LERYLEATAPFDAIHHIGRAKPAAILFQFARRDEVVTERAAKQYSRSGSKPKSVKWYDARHEDIFKNAKALIDRANWLRKQIGIGDVKTPKPGKPVSIN